MTVNNKKNIKKKSFVVTDGPDRAPARAMLRAVGVNDEDMEKETKTIKKKLGENTGIKEAISTVEIK